MRIAYFSPLPPLKTGVAEYSAELLPEIARHCDIDVYVSDYAPDAPQETSNLRILPYREFEAAHEQGRYDHVVYHIANNADHSYIYRQAVRTPGVVVLHDFNLHYLIADTTIIWNDWPAYFEEIRHNAGEEPMANAARVWRGEIEPEYAKYPLNRRILEDSLGLIVNNGSLLQMVEQTSRHAPAIVLPHGVSQPPANIRKTRAHLGLEDATVIGAFGFMKPYKRIYSILRALHALRDLRPEVHLLLAGEEHPHYPLDPLIAELNLSGRVHRQGFVPTDELWGCVEASDICCNLRFPTVGESSGPLMKIMALGKPVVVSDIGSYSELPDDCCVKIPASDTEIEFLTAALRDLIRSTDGRRRIGERASAWALDGKRSWRYLAEGLLGFCNQVSRPGPRVQRRAPHEAARPRHPLARIREIKPPFAIAGEGELLLKICGGPFISSTVGRLNGRPCPTRFRGVGELDVLVCRDELKESRRVYIDAFDPLQDCSGFPYGVRSPAQDSAEPSVELALPSGFYIFEARLVPGTLDGMMELTTTANPAAPVGDIHFGIGVPPSYLPPASCTFSLGGGRTGVFLNALSGGDPATKITAWIRRSCDHSIVQEAASSGSSLAFEVVLEAGVYALEVAVECGSGTLLTGQIHANGITSVTRLSGWAEETMVGFVAFHVPDSFQAAVTTRCRTLGTFGADRLTIEVKDSSRNLVSAHPALSGSQ
jgi:glycosyltransferase involved in cell wall biosynthesis